MKVGSAAPVEIARVAFDPDRRPVRGALKLIWLTVDGSELLVLQGHTLEHIRIDGASANRIIVATDARDIAATEDVVFVLTSNSPARVRSIRRPFGKENVVMETVLETDADGLYTGPGEGELLLWSQLRRMPEARGDLRLANLLIKSVRDVHPPDGVVLHLIPLKDGTRAVLHWWDEPHELSDGTMKTVFSVWDYGTDRSLRSYASKEGWEMHCTVPPCEAIPL